MNASDLIKKFEGLRLKVYLDSAGLPTVGYGHKVQKRDRLAEGQWITIDLAERFFEQDFSAAKRDLARLVQVPLSQGQEAAILSWLYNVGGGQAKGSKVVTHLNAGDPWSVPALLKEWCHADGRVDDGLVKRREEESALFTAGTPPKPSVLRRGDKGPEVAQLQEALIRLGYLDPRVRAGGLGGFGPATERAVKAFQASAGLNVDGVVGPVTRAALDAAGRARQEAP